MFCCLRCSHLSTIWNNIVEPESGVIILFNIVDNCEQCGKHCSILFSSTIYCNNVIVFSRVVWHEQIVKTSLKGNGNIFFYFPI
jgi:late competence protein required for DNA uptake (superfamily II DNA/RNA helicase)